MNDANAPQDEAVPSPWTPVEARAIGDGVEVGVWGRNYRFSDDPLPSSIVTSGQELLASPVRLVGRADGAELAWSGIRRQGGGPVVVGDVPAAPPVVSGWLRGSAAWDKAGVVVLRSSAAQATLSGWLQGPEILVSAAVRIEYDGMMRVDLVVTPHVGSSPRLEQLWLEVPLRRERASLFTYWPQLQSAVETNPLANSGALPAEGLTLPFRPFLWLGWEEGGLSWFAESDHAWLPADAGRAIEVLPRDDEVLLRLRLIDSAPPAWRGRKDHWWGGALAPVTITFGLQATPVKPWPHDFHQWRLAHLDYGDPMPDYQIEKQPAAPGRSETILDHLAARGVRAVAFHEKWTPIQNYWEAPRADAIRQTVRACHQRDIKVSPYLGYELSTLAPEWADTADRILVKDADGNLSGGWQRWPPQRDYMVCYNSPWQERFVEGVARMLDDYGFDGIYLDGTTMPWACANAAHGCGARAADGSVHPTYPIFAVRRLMKRLYAAVTARGGRITAHQSSCCLTPTLAFCHSYWDGEHLPASVKADPVRLFPLSAFRAEFLGRNFGVPCEFLGGAESLAYTLIHDVRPRPCGCGRMLDQIAGVWDVMARFDADRAQWHPYWRSRHLVQVTPQTVKTSLYLHRAGGAPGARALFVLANLSGEATEARIRLDRQALGFGDAALEARDELTGDRLLVEGSALQVPLGPLQAALLLVHDAGK